uniref:Uncharacterized protein n=1 Tax=Parascaris univalens TaxID=6257 RepID=A0A915CIB1_PARUN
MSGSANQLVFDEHFLIISFLFARQMSSLRGHCSIRFTRQNLNGNYSSLAYRRQHSIQRIRIR